MALESCDLVANENSEVVADSQVHTLSGSRRLVLYPLRALAWLWMRTLRFRVAPEDRALLDDTSVPTVLVFWHNRLFVVSEIFRCYRRSRPVFALVSASRDGAWLAAFAEMFGLRAVRGSSSRRGREAIFELATRLADGNDVALTPDGPRGPLYSFRPGPVTLVRRSQARVLLVGSRSPSAWRLRSWDRFILPRPFSTVTLVCRLVPAAQLLAEGEEAGDNLRNALLEMNDA